MGTYSTFWRINRAGSESLEMALALKALRKVAGHLGRNVKPVFWRGMVASDQRFILLDPGRVRGTYPIPGDKFDLLVGEIVSEGLSSIESREWVLKQVRSAVSDPGALAGEYLENMLHAAEDIYNAELIRSTIWFHYLSCYWRDRLVQSGRDPSLPPSPAGLASFWRRKTILGSWPGSALLHGDYWQPLKTLIRYTDPIREAAALPSLSKRRNARRQLYPAMWSELFETLSQWETFSPLVGVGIDEEDGFRSTDPADDDDHAPEDDPEFRDHRLTPELAEEISEILGQGEVDLTAAVKVAVEDPEAHSMPTRFRQGVARSEQKADAIEIRHLKRIFRQQADLMRQHRKLRRQSGLIQGRLKARLLYRVPLDGRVFTGKSRETAGRWWRICILADASSSMSGKSGKLPAWELVEKALAAVAEAMQGSRNELEIYAYAEEGGICTITQLFHGNQLYTAAPRGRTPSGQAIMAAALLMRPCNKKNMIIHLTDGAANCGLSIADAIRHCERHKVDVFTIGCGCNRHTRSYLSQVFPGGRLYFLSHIRDLPVGLKMLFQRQFIKRSTP